METSVTPMTFDKARMYIAQGDLVLDVGGGMGPLSRANWVIDFLPWNEMSYRNAKSLDIWSTPFFSKNSWISWDICTREPWPFDDKQFDFVWCSHVLEDVRDPIWVCQEIMRVGKKGYIETPSRIFESMPGVERTRYCGYSHHHWLCELTDGGIEFLFKHAQLNSYSRFHLTVGPKFQTTKRDHHWLESLDFLTRWFLVMKRWFWKINPQYASIGFFWEKIFECREKVLIDKSKVESDFMEFKTQCEKIHDLWVRR